MVELPEPDYNKVSAVASKQARQRNEKQTVAVPGKAACKALVNGNIKYGPKFAGKLLSCSLRQMFLHYHVHLLISPGHFLGIQ